MEIRPARTALFMLSGMVLSGLLAAPVFAQQSNSPQQSGSQDSSSSQSSQPAQNKQQSQQAQPPAKKSAAQENPFPEGVSEHAAQQQKQQEPSSGAPDAPDSDQQPPQSGQKPGDAAKENPFPEDVSKSAAAAASKGNDTSSSSSSSSSNSSSDDSNADADLPPDTGRRKLKKPSDKDIQSGSLAGEGKAQEDVRVGRFYLGTGDYKGAYGRFSEAARLDPANIDAIYGLAAAADGLHHTDEALTNYKLYLEVAPDGHDAKSARKAIRSLSK
jgi:tetratricopeptide (TPR) repeat protein